MYLGIRTRYLGPTDTQGARISATTSEGKRHVYPYRYELSATRNHEHAARLALMARLLSRSLPPHTGVSDRANAADIHPVEEARGWHYTVAL